MTQLKKLIEVAMPIKEISAESIRDKSIRHGHISTLHLWWARRPLPVCRAVVFASLVPDPLDPNCPDVFKEAVALLLGKERDNKSVASLDVYKPYEDIPYTAIFDPMEDNLRNRLLMFIGKFSGKYIANEKCGKTTAAGEQLSDESLIKWDNKNNEEIINTARKLIWVAHNCKGNNKKLSIKELINDFDKHYKAIKDAENKLYSLIDRHIETKKSKSLTENLHKALESFLDKMPIVFDPFAGGGAIPLEAARLGCRTFGNDINPVAYIIQKGSLEFPQKFGKPITYSKMEFIELYGKEEFNKIRNENLVYENGQAVGVNIANRLSFDVEYFTKKLLNEAEKKIGYLYPVDEKGNKPIAYYWARVGTCSNLSCKAEVPLLKQFYLANTKTKQIYLEPIISDKTINFRIKKGKYDENKLEGWNNRGNLKCPCCGSLTDVKSIKNQFKNNEIKLKPLAVIFESDTGKDYRLPSEKELKMLNQKVVHKLEISELMNPCSSGGDTFSWNVNKYHQLFIQRQLFFLNTILDSFNKIKTNIELGDYGKSLLTYLAIFIDRIAVVNTSFGVWHIGGEKLERIMSRQTIGMVFDFPESNPFCNSSGSALNQVDWILRYIESESSNPFNTLLQNASSGEKAQFKEKYLTAVITDPPYYNSIAYADLSDFFYVWLKRTLIDIFPMNFATPQTPKSDECTALKHHHGGSFDKAKQHFENKLLEIFDAIEYQTIDLVSIMFAHQSTEAWTTLCNSILGARMNITGSWATDTEMTGALKTNKSFLSSSVTVSCKPAERKGCGGYKEVRKEIEKTVANEVTKLYGLGFRGADLLTACFGQAVSEFGRYEKVEKADGSEVTVAELLEMARESAFNALLKGFDGDDFTKFYIGWLQLYGFAESDFDDAAKFSRVGLSINVSDLFSQHIFIKDGNKQSLGTFEQRLKANKKLGEQVTGSLIDQVHKAMFLYKAANRNTLLQYVANYASSPEGSFWRVITSLCEVLPAGSDDHKQAIGLLANKDSLIRESKTAGNTVQEEQIKLPI